ncbi:MAG: ATP-binding cassette domain-containing protein [Bacillota bacterium]
MLDLKAISKIYTNGTVETKALDRVSLSFDSYEFVAVLGPSGCGKTTLLNIIGGLDRYTSGDLVINGKSTEAFKESDWDTYRNHSIGFVFQTYNLIGHITILENVELGMTLSGVSREARKSKSKEVLRRVGLSDQFHKHPYQLSSGQKQRVAIARALVNDPDIILADEPTGALDSNTGEEVMELIREISDEKLVIMVTHNEEIAQHYANRIIELKDGSVLSDTRETYVKHKVRGYTPKDTSMAFTTALKLSFNNLKSKFTRTLITAFAGSIGIIGIALVLAIGNGFGQEINRLERETLSTLPITISEFPMEFRGGPPLGVNDDAYNPSTDFDPLGEGDRYDHINTIDEDYIDYVNAIESDLINSIQYTYGVDMLFMRDNDSGIETSMDKNIRFRPLSNSPAYLEGQYSLEAGRYPESSDEVVIVVDVLNRIDEDILEFLGVDPAEKTIAFEAVVGLDLRVANNDDIDFDFNQTSMTIEKNVDDESYQNGIPLEIAGVIKGVPDGLETENRGIFYQDSLEEVFIAANEGAEICAMLDGALEEDALTDEQRQTLEIQRRASGCDDSPALIRIYPDSFEDKDDVLLYLDGYNDGRPDNDKVLYDDLAATISGVLGSIVNNVSLILVAFAAISLVVSSIMIGIITYVSVLERTKEIGILRSLGARKKDISRVFNAESFIVGLFAGALGIVITLILSIPLERVFANLLSGFDNVVNLRFDHALMLIGTSIILTFIAGLIPARIAAQKNPVEALRHNE